MEPMAPEPAVRSANVGLSVEELSALTRAMTGMAPSAEIMAGLRDLVVADPTVLTSVVRCLLLGPDAMAALAALARRWDRPRSGPAPEVSVFRCEGDVWAIGFDGTIVRLRDVRGFRYLARLLAEPGQPVHVQDLVASCAGRSRRAVRPEQARLSVTKAIRAALTRLATAHPALATHLSATVRRGQYCVYLPDPRHPIQWLT
jgi:hypothetical protein